jgi:hypothetical protein
MQPYFVPYAGYFRLLTTADLFVIYDCVQFPRRGWVHRNRLPNQQGEASWLTLPLAKARQDTLIRDLAFQEDASALLAKRLQSFRFPTESSPEFAAILAMVCAIEQPPIDYLVGLLEYLAEALRLPWQVLRSSSLDVPPEVHGSERILEIARRLGAKRYVNSPGGRELYEPKMFDAAGIELRFLTPYVGSPWSVLWRLACESPAALNKEIMVTSMVEP